MIKYKYKRGVIMEKIKSFTINHDTLEKGLYISRIDDNIITYDMFFLLI